jgi:hypothetical protein
MNLTRTLQLPVTRAIGHPLFEPRSSVADGEGSTPVDGTTMLFVDGQAMVA